MSDKPETCPFCGAEMDAVADGIGHPVNGCILDCMVFDIDDWNKRQPDAEIKILHTALKKIALAYCNGLYSIGQIKPVKGVSIEHVIGGIAGNLVIQEIAVARFPDADQPKTGKIIQ